MVTTADVTDRSGAIVGLWNTPFAGLINKVRRFKESRIASINHKCVIVKVTKAPIYRKTAVYRG